jgi:hypothetical protein
MTRYCKMSKTCVDHRLHVYSTCRARGTQIEDAGFWIDAALWYAHGSRAATWTPEHEDHSHCWRISHLATGVCIAVGRSLDMDFWKRLALCRQAFVASRWLYMSVRGIDR